MNSRIVVLMASLLILISTSSHAAGTGSQSDGNTEIACELIEDLNFNGTKANQSIEHQLSLGPRIPGSAASQNLLSSISENLTKWIVTIEIHDYDGITLRNLEATLNPGAGDIVVFMAHYDTRQVADREENESNASLPVPGANDGASGVAVLLEMARLIPNMNLSHEVRLVFTDAEDQGGIIEGGFSIPWATGSKRWTENLSSKEIDEIDALIVVDMVGDSDLTLTHTSKGDAELWNSVDILAGALGMIEDVTDCEGNYGDGTLNPDITIGVIDDHVPPYEVGIPAIDIIDISYGEGASPFTGHWHTLNDTHEHVSGDSLERVGEILELGLLSGIFLRQEIQIDYPVEHKGDFEEEDTLGVEEESQMDGAIILFILLIVIAAPAALVFAENEGEL